eukprot:CAMPEP_0194133734 /NCGR_PEP_ID=MMETSP0152-20130528/3777_1 /TAXON_ID=1049557 /ORGANISM="Thalassiothrix antarctica, Strain L6-D1" /LENGTH=303 /DNA_ID=CAMNT_0038829085 /DNA_START=253 /DNA_END=1165 /DNA_ORIENTATION=+
MSMIVLSHDSEDEILLKQNISSPLNPSLDCCDEEKLKPKFIAAAAGTRSLKQDPESIIANDEGGKVTQGENSSSFSCQKYSTTANTSQQSNESFSSVPLLRRDSLLTTTSNNPEAENSSIAASTGTIASSPSKLDILRARHKMLQNTSCQKIEVVRRSLSDGSSSYCNNSFNNSKPCQIFAKSSNNSDYLDDDLTVEASFWSESHRSPQPATAVQQQQQQNLALMKPPKEVVLMEKEKEAIKLNHHQTQAENITAITLTSAVLTLLFLPRHQLAKLSEQDKIIPKIAYNIIYRGYRLKMIDYM